MGVEAQRRPGVLVRAIGVLIIGLSAAPLLSGPGPEFGGPWFAVAVGAAGAGLTVWGFAQLRRARAAFPNPSWCGLSRADLVAFGVVAVWLPVWAALSAEQRDGLMRSFREAFELVHVARGHR